MAHPTNRTQGAEQQSQLFAVRLWHLSADEFDLQGKAQHVLSGETHHFQSWQTLQDFLIVQMDCAERANVSIALGSW
mgnify:CR=1 FL=1